MISIQVHIRYIFVINLVNEIYERVFTRLLAADNDLDDNDTCLMIMKTGIFVLTSYGREHGCDLG